ncbi:hypothetical protein BASA61_000027 [Batrachochytrium salamandrivorans]|nr:hypothetical protein BASA61_000027 [Batrachochytrium salamandrivorans]
MKYIDPYLITTSAIVDIGLASCIFAFFAALYGFGYFVLSGLRRTFTKALIGLAIINLLAAITQVSEVFYVYTEASIGTYVWRNIMFVQCALFLNLLQIEIFGVFNGGLIRTNIFKRENMKWVWLYAISFHILCTAPMYLDGWVWEYNESRLLTKWATYGPALYSTIVGIWGISQNLFILQKVHVHTSQISAMSTGSTDTSQEHRRNGARTIRSLIILVLIFDITAVSTFAAASAIGSDVTNTLHYVLLQMSLSIIGIHLFAETFLFERIVRQFQKRSSTGNSFNGSYNGAEGGAGNRTTVPVIVSPTTSPAVGRNKVVAVTIHKGLEDSYSSSKTFANEKATSWALSACLVRGQFLK